VLVVAVVGQIFFSFQLWLEAKVMNEGCLLVKAN